MSDQLTLEHVRAAHARIRGSIVATPTLHSQTLSKLTGANIYLKFENHQFTAAYKERGALNAILLLTEWVQAVAKNMPQPTLPYHYDTPEDEVPTFTELKENQ